MCEWVSDRLPSSTMTMMTKTWLWPKKIIDIVHIESRSFLFWMSGLAFFDQFFRSFLSFASIYSLFQFSSLLLNLNFSSGLRTMIIIVHDDHDDGHEKWTLIDLLSISGVKKIFFSINFSYQWYSWKKLVERGFFQ